MGQDGGGYSKRESPAPSTTAATTRSAAPRPKAGDKQATAPSSPIRTLSPGERYRIVGGSYAVTVDLGWFSDGAQSDGGMWMHPQKMVELLGYLRGQGLIAWATDTGIAAASKRMGIWGSGPETTVQLGAELFGHVGLPPNAPAMVSRYSDGLIVAVALDTRGLPPGETVLKGAAVDAVVSALAAYTGLIAISTLTEIDMRVGEGAASRKIPNTSLAWLFGAEAWTGWVATYGGKSIAQGGQTAQGAQIVDTPITDAERQWVTTWIAMNLGPTAAGAKVAVTRELLGLLREIDASDRRAAIVAMLTSAEGAERALDVEALRGAIQHAAYDAERAKHAPAPDDVLASKPTAVDAIIESEVAADVITRGGLVVDGDEVSFEVLIDWSRHPMDPVTEERFKKRAWRIEVDWVFEHGGIEQVVRTGSAGVSHVLTIPRGEQTAIWTVHAFVRTSHFWPTQLAPALVEVKSTRDRMDDLAGQAFGDAAAVAGLRKSEHDFDIGVLDDDLSHQAGLAHDHGQRYEGALSFAVRSPEERRQARQAEIARLQAMIAYLRSRPGRFTDAVEAAESTLARRREEAELLDAREAWEQPFEVRGTFLSRDANVPSGALTLFGTSVYDSGSSAWWVTLHDNSLRASEEMLIVQGAGDTFEEGLEEAFVDLCKAYPEGRVAVFAQRLTPDGPTTDLVGFELATTSVIKTMRAIAGSAATQLVIGLSGLFLMMFPGGLAALPMYIGMLHSLVTTVDELRERSRTGTLTDERFAVGVGNLALSLLPVVRMARPVSASPGALFALHVAEYAGNVVMFSADVKAQLEEIEANDVSVLAESYAALLELESSTHASDPRLAERRKQIDARARAVGDALHEALAKALENNLISMLPDGLLHGANLGRGGHVGDPVGGSAVSPGHEADVGASQVTRQPEHHESATRSDTPRPHEADEVTAVIEAMATPGEDPRRRPGAVDNSSTVDQLGQRIASHVGGARYVGDGAFELEVDSGVIVVTVERTSGAPRIVRHGERIVAKISRGTGGMDLERVVVGKLTEVRHQELRRSRGEKVDGHSALGPHGDGAVLSAADMAKIAELRVLREQHAAQAERGPDGEAIAAAIHRDIVTSERALGMHDDSVDGERRRAAVEAQIVVQGDAARRAKAATRLEGQHGHPGIELHTHFVGIVEAEVFRDRAARAAGGDPASWIPLLERIAAFDGDEAKHHTDARGKWRRAAAGDAVRIAREASSQVSVLIDRVEGTDPVADAAYRRAAETVAEEAVRVALAASPETDFNSAYEIRDRLIKETFGAKRADGTVELQDRYDDFIREAVLQLARDGIGYMETSASIKKVGGVFRPERIRAVVAALEAEGTILPGQIDVRLLSMMLTGHFGARKPGLPEIAKPSGRLDEDVDAVTRQGNDQVVVGGDVGGPEQFNWSPESPEQFFDWYMAGIEQADRTGEPVVRRPHVGEGGVDPHDGKPFHTDKDRHLTPGGELEGYERARNNIDRMLTGLELARDRGKLDHSKVIVRLGHVTHATPDQVIRMHALGVIAEVNLGSNVATGSVSQTEGSHGPRAKRERLEDHSFPTLVYYDASIAISTDSGPVMSTTLRDEYARAKRMLEDVLAGRLGVRVAAADARIADSNTYRGTAVPGRPGEYELRVADFTPAELDRFLHGYEKLYADAEAYYRRRPKPAGASEAAPYGGAHHLDLATEHGLRAAHGTALYEGPFAAVEAAAAEYEAAGYHVVQQDVGEGVLVVTVTSPDGTFAVTLRASSGSR